MKNKCLILFLLLSYSLFSQAPSLNWAKSFGGTAHTEAHYMAVDSVGNVYTAGPFTQTTDFDPGPGTFTMSALGFSDNFISKLDSSGNFLWAGSITGNALGAEYITGIALDKFANLYVAGYCPSGTDIDPGPATLTLASNYDHSFLLKLDGSGNLLWAKTFTGPNAQFRISVMEVDDNGQIFLGGNFIDIADFDPGPASFTLASVMNGYEDLFLMKLDASANFVWAKSLPCNAGFNFMQSIAVDHSGNVYATGHFEHTVDFDPGPAVHAISTSTVNFSNWDIFILKLDATGNFSWVNTYGDNINDFGKALEIDQQNNIHVTGCFNGVIDFDAGPATHTLSSAGNLFIFIMQLDPAGQLQWIRQSGGGFLAPEGKYMALDADKNMYLTGAFSGITNLDPGFSNYTLTCANSNAFISKYDSLGHFVWGGQLGGSNSDRGYDVAIGPKGVLYTTGAFSSAVGDFDPGPGTYTLTAGTSTNSTYVVKLNQTCFSVPIIHSTKEPLICSGESMIFTASGNGTPTWYANTTLTQTLAAGSSYTTAALSPGTYTFFVDYKNPSCASPLASIVLTVEACTFVQENEKEQTRLYPNPSKDVFIVQCNSYGPATELKIKDVSGKEIYSGSLMEQENKIVLSEFPAGIYFLQIFKSSVPVEIIKIVKTP